MGNNCCQDLKQKLGVKELSYANTETQMDQLAFIDKQKGLQLSLNYNNNNNNISSSRQSVSSSIKAITPNFGQFTYRDNRLLQAQCSLLNVPTNRQLSFLVISESQTFSNNKYQLQQNNNNIIQKSSQQQNSFLKQINQVNLDIDDLSQAEQQMYTNYQYQEQSSDPESFTNLLFNAKKNCLLEFKDQRFLANENSLSSKQAHFNKVTAWLRLSQLQSQIQATSLTQQQQIQINQLASLNNNNNNKPNINNDNKNLISVNNNYTGNQYYYLFPPELNSILDPSDLLPRFSDYIKYYNNKFQNNKEIAGRSINFFKNVNLQLINALIQLCSRPMLLYRLFEIKQQHPLGLYCVWICRDGAFKQYVIDDSIPIIQKQQNFKLNAKNNNINLMQISNENQTNSVNNSYSDLPALKYFNQLQYDYEDEDIDDKIFPGNTVKPAFSGLRSGFAWLLLLEKAYAKAYGSYEHIWQYGSTENILRDLTGAPTEQFDLDFLKEISQDNQQSADFLQQKQVLLNFLLRNFELNYLIYASCTQNQGVQKNQKDQINSASIILSQFMYPVLDVSESDGVQYVKILELIPDLYNFNYRNSEFKGIKEESKPSVQNWVEINEFIHRFSSIHVSKVHPDYFYSFKNLTVPKQTSVNANPVSSAFCFAIEFTVDPSEEDDITNNGTNQKKKNSPEGFANKKQQQSHYQQQSEPAHAFLSIVQKDSKNFFDNKVYTYAFIRMIVCEGEIINSYSTKKTTNLNKNKHQKQKKPFSFGQEDTAKQKQKNQSDSSSNSSQNPHKYNLTQYIGSVFGDQRDVFLEANLNVGTHILYVEIEQTCKLSCDFVLSAYSSNRIHFHQTVLLTHPFQYQQYQLLQTNPNIANNQFVSDPMMMLEQKVSQNQKKIPEYLQSFIAEQQQKMHLLDYIILLKLLSDPTFFYYDISKAYLKEKKASHIQEEQRKSPNFDDNNNQEVADEEEGSINDNDQDVFIAQSNELSANRHKIQAYKEDQLVLRCTGKTAGYIYFIYLNFSPDSDFKELAQMENLVNLEMCPFQQNIIDQGNFFLVEMSRPQPQPQLQKLLAQNQGGGSPRLKQYQQQYTSKQQQQIQQQQQQQKPSKNNSYYNQSNNNNNNLLLLQKKSQEEKNQVSSTAKQIHPQNYVKIVKFRVKAELQGFFSYEVSFPWVAFTLSEETLLNQVQNHPSTKKQRHFQNQPIDIWEHAYFYSGGCVLYYVNNTENFHYREKVQFVLRNLVGDGFNAEEEISFNIGPSQYFLLKMLRVKREDAIQYGSKYSFSITRINDDLGGEQQLQQLPQKQLQQMLLFQSQKKGDLAVGGDDNNNNSNNGGDKQQQQLNNSHFYSNQDFNDLINFSQSEERSTYNINSFI